MREREKESERQKQQQQNHIQSFRFSLSDSLRFCRLAACVCQPGSPPAVVPSSTAILFPSLPALLACRRRRRRRCQRVLSRACSPASQQLPPPFAARRR